MKRQIISPLCSALIIPGLGQIINHNIKKGLIILGIVFILFIAGTVKLAQMILYLANGQTTAALDTDAIMQRLQDMNLSAIYILFIAFGIVWVYSIWDAFLQGKKIDMGNEEILT
jgi:hypothetical protein